MNLDECKKCEYNIKHVADSVLCRYTAEIEHRVLSGDKVVGCPKDNVKNRKRER